MKLKRAAALLTASVLCLGMLAGCGNNGDTDIQDTEPAVNYEEFVTEFTAEDDAFYMDLLGGKAADTIMTADGLPVDVATYSYWLAYYLSYFEDSVNSSTITDGTVEIDWSAPWDDENTIADVMKEYAGSSATYYAVIQKVADDYGIALDDADRAAAAEDRMTAIHDVGETLWDQYVSGGYITESLYDEEAKEEWIMEKGAETYLKELSGIGSTDSAYNNISLLTALYEKTRDTVFGEGGEKAPSQEDLDTYVKDNNLVCVKFIYLSSYDESYNEVDRSEDAAEILAEIQASDDPAAAFAQHLEDSGEADFSQYPNGYIASTSDFSADILSALQDTEEGAIYGEVLSDDYGWYIMQRCAMDQDQLGERYREEAINDLLDEYLDDIEIVTTELYDNLDVDAYFDKIVDVQNSVYADDEASGEDTVTEEPAEGADDTDATEEEGTTEEVQPDPTEDPSTVEETPEGASDAEDTPEEPADEKTSSGENSANPDESESNGSASNTETGDPVNDAETSDGANEEIDSDFSVDKVQP